MNTTSRPAAEQTVISVLGDHPDTTAAGIATTGGLGRSTVSKILTKLESDGKVKRNAGGRDGARRLPDRWSLAGSRSRRSPQPASGDRLGPGQLDGLVLDYMRKHAADEPLGPTAVAKGLGRSSGAVGNCLKRLAAAGQVNQSGDHPRRYAIVEMPRA
jgi:MarR family